MVACLETDKDVISARTKPNLHVSKPNFHVSKPNSHVSKPNSHEVILNITFLVCIANLHNPNVITSIINYPRDYKLQIP